MVAGETEQLGRHNQHAPRTDAIRGFAPPKWAAIPFAARTGSCLGREREIPVGQSRRRLTCRQEPGDFAKVETRTGAVVSSGHAAIQRRGAVSSVRANHDHAGSTVCKDEPEQRRVESTITNEFLHIAQGRRP